MDKNITKDILSLIIIGDKVDYNQHTINQYPNVKLTDIYTLDNYMRTFRETRLVTQYGLFLKIDDEPITQIKGVDAKDGVVLNLRNPDGYVEITSEKHNIKLFIAKIK